MSLPPISGERSGIPRRGQQPRQTKRQNNPANAPYASPESFDDSVSNTGASSTSTAATAAAAALDRRDASDFRIVVAARIRPFTAREVQQWRRERRAVESPEDVEEARRARAALRQPFGPGHKSLNATQGGLDSTWTRRHDNEEDNINANGQHGAFDASDVPQPVVEVESDGTTIALLDPQSVTQDGALAPAVRNAFTYDYVYSSFAPNVVLDTQCGPAGRHGNNNSGGGNNGAPSPYVILEGDDEGASASERQTSSRHTPAQELQAEAEQVAIYEQLAIPLVDAAMRGYNTCMFAYGQTGSGKTYTMMGTPRHPGLIPRLCRRLFSEITTRNEEGGGLNSTASASSPALVTLQLSYMEIYNEQVRDLLKQRPKNAILHYKSRFDKKDVDSDEYRTLKVRHHPSKGIYVDGLTSVPVRTWDECEAYLQAGNALRTQCSTAMNAKSSRSHAIFQLQMTQRESTGGRVRGREVALETFSKINLVDLAGSERNTQSKTTGKHLAEANSINASLSTLRRVLDGLIANRAAALSGGTGAGGKGKKSAVVIPYRESLLTYVLSDNLGGNSFTVMCANVSPCASSAGETESTLRYATLAKAVVNHAKLNEAPTARVIREMRDQLRVMQEALRSAPDPSHVAALEEGVQLSEALLREMKNREGDYEAQLQAQAEEAAALQEAVEAHKRQETYWRDEARRQQREVEELREALFEATQNGAQSSGVHLPSLTDPRGAAGAGAAAASKKRSKSQQQQQQSPAKKRRGSSLAVEPVSAPSSSGAAAAAALAAVSARDGRASRARATPLSLLGDARTKSKKRPSLSTLPEAPASAPDKTRRASLDSGPVVASAPSSGEARALAARTRVNGVMGRPPLSTKGYGDVNDDDVDGPAAADNDFVERETGEADVPAFYHTEHFLAVAASDDYADDHAPAAAAAAVVPHNAPPHSTYEQLDFTQLQEEALRVGGTSDTFEGGLEIEGVAATPSRRQWPTSSPRVAAARKSQAASDRRRSSTTAAATARQQNTKNKKMKLKKKTGKGGAAGKEGGASRGVSEERAGTEENEGWPPGETSTSFELPSAPAAAASVSASAHAAHAAHHVKSDAVHNTSPLSPHTPHGEEGLTEMHSANPEDQLGGEEQQRMLSGSSSSVDAFGNVARGVAKVPHHDTDEGDEYEEDYWNAQEPTGEEMFADDVDSAAASLNPSSALAANAMPSLHKTTKKTKAGGASHLNTGASAGARHYSTVDTLH